MTNNGAAVSVAESGVWDVEIESGLPYFGSDDRGGGMFTLIPR